MDKLTDLELERLISNGDRVVKASSNRPQLTSFGRDLRIPPSFTVGLKTGGEFVERASTEAAFNKAVEAIEFIR